MSAVASGSKNEERTRAEPRPLRPLSIESRARYLRSSPHAESAPARFDEDLKSQQRRRRRRRWFTLSPLPPVLCCSVRRHRRQRKKEFYNQLPRTTLGKEQMLLRASYIHNSFTSFIRFGSRHGLTHSQTLKRRNLKNTRTLLCDTVDGVRASLPL